MKHKEMSAVSLSRLFIALIVFGIAAIGGGFYYSGILLKQQAVKTDHAQIDAELAQDEINNLKTLAAYLEQNKTIVSRAAQVAAESTQYQYQDQVINDITTYAARNGISISSFDFQAAATTTATTSPKKTAVTIMINSKIPYSDMLRFVKSIEQNLTKMQITSLSLAPDSQVATNLLNPSLTVEVYLQ